MPSSKIGMDKSAGIEELRAAMRVQMDDSKEWMLHIEGLNPSERGDDVRCSRRV
jgi:hypothetical protein